MKKTVIIGIMALLAVLVISTASAAASEYYITPQDSSVPKYYDTTEVGIWIDATEPIQSGKVWIDYTYCCANIIAYTPNTSYFESQMPVMVDGRLSLGYDHWVYGMPTNQLAGVYHIGNFTIQCCNEDTDYCKTDLIFNDDKCMLLQVEGSEFKKLSFVTTDGTFTCEAPAPNVVVTVNNASFGTMLAGNRQELNVSLTLNNTGTVDANITAVFKTNVSGVYGLKGTGGNIIPGTNFELGLDGDEKALTNTTATTVISTIPAGKEVTYDAILEVPAGQTAGDYSGIVELIIEESSA